MVDILHALFINTFREGFEAISSGEKSSRDSHEKLGNLEALLTYRAKIVDDLSYRASKIIESGGRLPTEYAELSGGSFAAELKGRNFPKAPILVHLDFFDFFLPQDLRVFYLKRAYRRFKDHKVIPASLLLDDADSKTFPRTGGLSEFLKQVRASLRDRRYRMIENKLSLDLEPGTEESVSTYFSFLYNYLKMNGYVYTIFSAPPQTTSLLVLQWLLAGALALEELLEAFKDPDSIPSLSFNPARAMSRYLKEQYGMKQYLTHLRVSIHWSAEGKKEDSPGNIFLPSISTHSLVKVPFSIPSNQKNKNEPRARTAFLTKYVEDLFSTSIMEAPVPIKVPVLYGFTEKDIPNVDLESVQKRTHSRLLSIVREVGQ